MMKKISVLLMGVFLYTSITAQDNAAGLVLTSFAVKAIKVRYERKLSDNWSVATHLGFQIPRRIGFIEDDSSDPNANITAKFTGINASPEIRWYPRGEGMHGFYLAGYLRFTGRTITVEDVSGIYTETITGKWNSIGGGLQLGKQWVINDIIAIDFYWFGLGVARHMIKLEFESNNPSIDFEEWKVDVDETWGDAPLIGKKLKTTATSSSLKMEVPFIFPDFRFGLAVSYLF